MFKELIAACALITVSGGCWAGQYDGVWQIQGDTGYYEMIRHQDDGTFVVVFLGSDAGRLNDLWTATLIGSISGNTASNLLATEALNSTNVKATITFSSTTAATISFSQCTPKPGKPADSCAPLNTPGQLVKIF